MWKIYNIKCRLSLQLNRYTYTYTYTCLRHSFLFLSLARICVSYFNFLFSIIRRVRQRVLVFLISPFTYIERFIKCYCSMAIPTIVARVHCVSPFHKPHIFLAYIQMYAMHCICTYCIWISNKFKQVKYRCTFHVNVCETHRHIITHLHNIDASIDPCSHRIQ